MAIFDKKNESEESSAVAGEPIQLSVAKGRNVLIYPRISEKSGMLNKINKYVFKVQGKINKVEVKKAIEKLYNVKVTGVNMIVTKSRSRNFGRTSGKTAAFKKAIVTLAEGQKIEAAKES